MIYFITARLLGALALVYAGVDIADRCKAQEISPHVLAIALILIAVNRIAKEVHHA